MTQPTPTIASADDLLYAGPAAEGEPLELPSGRWVMVRPISRYEWLLLGKGTEDGTLIDRRLIKVGLVEPKMSEVQIEKWQRTPGLALRDFGAVTDRIRELSGFGEGAAKSAVAEIRDGR